MQRAWRRMGRVLGVVGYVALELLGCLELLVLPFRFLRWQWQAHGVRRRIQLPDEVQPNCNAARNRLQVQREWSQLLGRRDVLIVRTETTGFGDQVEVIEVAAVDTTGERRFHALSLPEGPIRPEASRGHGLTRSVLKRAGARPWPEIHGELSDVIRGASLVLCWNAMHDPEWLKMTARRHNRWFHHGRWQDVMEAYRRLGHEGNDLDTVVQRHGVQVLGPPRRAETDCRRILAVMRALGDASP